ncbi:hypothetical protein HN873_072904 [Arachis hypogaea]
MTSSPSASAAWLVPASSSPPDMPLTSMLVPPLSSPTQLQASALDNRNQDSHGAIGVARVGDGAAKVARGVVTVLLGMLKGSGAARI